MRRGLAIVVVVLAAGCGGDSGPNRVSWHDVAPLLHERSAHAVVSDRDTVYAIGGTGADGRPVLSVERYDGRVWTEETTLPAGGLNAPAAVMLHDKIYVIGGFTGTTNVPTDRVHVYDTKSKQWTELAPLPAPRGGHAAAALRGQIHVIGGGDQISTLSLHSIYEPSTGHWREAATLSNPRGSLAALVVKGKLWAIGGRSGPDDFGDVDIFDPVTGAWTPGPSIEPRGTHGAAFFRGAIHVFGGESQSEGRVLDDVLRLDPEGQRWRDVSSLPTARGYARAVQHDDGILVVGGSTSAGASHASQGSKIVERYGPRP